MAKKSKGHGLKYFLDHPQIKRHPSPGNDYSEKAQKAISRKMSKMEDEDMPHDQKVAIAIEHARDKGYEVPKEDK